MATVLVVAGFVLLFVLRSTLITNARDMTVQQLDSLVETIQADDAEDFAGDVRDSGIQFAQILQTDGTILVASKDADEGKLYDGAVLEPGESYFSKNAGLVGILDFDEHLIAAQGVATAEGNVLVVVGAETSIERDAVSTVGWVLLAGVPLLVILAGGLMWFLIGRALLPVERIRETVAGISQKNLDDRVVLPNTADEIERLAHTMNAMLDRLQKADESQRRFVTDASHELRSPLATLRTGLEVAVADPTGRTWLESSDMLQNQTQRMGYLVEDLLTLAKIDDSGLRFRMEDVDLDDVLNQEARRLRSMSAHVVRTELVPVRMRGDANRLGQVFRNLVNNAERHAEGIIRISLSSQGDHVVVRIENDGDQIPAAERERIFDRFVRLDASRAREHGGSGLGLAISKEIILAHGGTIEVSQSPQGFTCFLVSLPLEPQVHPVGKEPADKLSSRNPATRFFSGKQRSPTTTSGRKQT
ncbi:sensor histidine kinase [Paeniglutamicibacter antarcticus]